jgi:hypothetical protein
VLQRDCSPRQHRCSTTATEDVVRAAAAAGAAAIEAAVCRFSFHEDPYGLCSKDCKMFSGAHIDTLGKWYLM